MSVPAVDAVLVGASAGGPSALEHVLAQIPVGFPVGIVVLQHMPAESNVHLATLLNRVCALDVAEAGPGEEIRPGRVLVAPAGKDVTFTKLGRRVLVCLSPPPPGSTYSPSIDRAFRSGVECFGHRLLGVLLTGMGEDGAKGLLEIRERGGRTIAEAESSAKVFGMPRAAADLLAAQEVRDLSEIGPRVVGIVTGSRP